MSSFDINQARLFLELLTGSNDAELNHCFQCFHDSETSIDTLNQPASFHARLDDCVEYFNQIQSYNYGVFVSLNKTDGKGREKQNIIGYRLLFIDVDNQTLPQLPIMPHFITQRDATHSHIYYLVKGVVTGDVFSKMQKQVALNLGTDEQVFDICRVVRLAGTYNCKDHLNPAMYNIVHQASDLLASGHMYELDEILAAFPIPEEKQIKFDTWCNNKNALETGEGFNDNKMYRERMISWLGRAEPAMLGSGSFTLIKVASYGLDLGIPLQECQDLCWEHYDPRCFPSWHSTEQKADFYATVARAYTYANNAVGCRTAVGKFTALNDVLPIQEPVGGWEGNKKLGKKKKSETPTINYTETNIETEREGLSEVDAAGMLAQLTNKSSTLDLARAFVSIQFPNLGLLKSEKVFYRYNGKCWEEISDEYIESEITFFYLSMKLKVSEVTNVRVALDRLCHVEKLQNNTWLNGRDDGDEMLVCENTLLNITDGNVELIPFTRDFFCLNHLGYDYDPNATCPEFEQWSNSVWDDKDNILMMGEVLGDALTTDCRHEKITVIVGKTRAGKSILTDCLRNMMGEHNTVSPALETISDNSMKHAMSKKKLILIPEATNVSNHKKFDVLGVLKIISGGDNLSYHRIYKGEGNNTKWGKIFLIANTMPDFTDESGALAGRYNILYFSKSFLGREDKFLKKKLLKEKSGILNFAIQGLKRLRMNGDFTLSQESMQMSEDAKNDMFMLHEFVENCLIIDTDSIIHRDTLYEAYKYDCKQNESSFKLHKAKFYKMLKSSHLPVSDARLDDRCGGKLRAFRGLRLNPRMDELLNNNTGSTVIAFKSVEDTNIKQPNTINTVVIPPPILKG